jgi:hypothetical protein
VICTGAAGDTPVAPDAGDSAVAAGGGGGVLAVLNVQLAVSVRAPSEPRTPPPAVTVKVAPAASADAGTSVTVRVVGSYVVLPVIVKPPLVTSCSASAPTVAGSTARENVARMWVCGDIPLAAAAGKLLVIVTFVPVVKVHVAAVGASPCQLATPVPRMTV